MKITALGHESWLVSDNVSNILIDPLLYPSFGSDKKLQFELSPGRDINWEAMPQVSAIVFTTEHLQHFHPKSLKTLIERYSDKLLSKTVFIPELFPAAAADFVEECGYCVERVEIQTSFHVGSLTLRYYMPKKGVLFWDNRVASLYVANEDRSGLFQSDTKISESFYTEVKQGVIGCPNVLIVTNNFNRSATGAIGLDNLLPIEDEKYSNLSGLRLLDELTSAPIKKLTHVPTIIIAGNGYVPPRKNIDPIWSNKALADIATQLSIVTKVYALDPGEVYDVDSSKITGNSADWIVLCDESYRKDSQGCVELSPRTTEPLLSSEEIKKHLDEMAKTWLITSYGQALMAQHQYLGLSVGPQRLVIQLTSATGNLQFVLDISKTAFLLVENEGVGAIKKYPFGIIVGYADYSKLIEGKLQAWEVVNLSASQWYVCGRYQSPLAFWLEYYNEQVDYDRAYRSYTLSADAALS